MFTGPNITTDGLVFGFDTGYPLAGNATALRFNKGQPTVNISPNHHASGHNPGGYGNVVTVADAPDKGNGWKKVTISNRGSNFRILKWQYTSHTEDIIYTHSAVFDWGNMRDKGYSIIFDGSGGGTRNYFRNGDYSTNGGSSINSNLSDGKFAGNIVKSGGTHSHSFFIYHSTTGVSGLNDYFYYKEFQVEINTHSTPYTLGTRSSTASLIDLTRTTDIDVSNVSFDNNAQMTFDGTDDRIYIPNSTFTNPTELTIESVFKRTSTLPDVVGCPIHRNDGSNGNVGNSEFTIAVYRDNSYYIYGSIGANTGTATWTNGNTGVICEQDIYYHVTSTWDGSNVRTYVNGDLKVTYSLTTYSNSGGNIRFGTSSDNGGTYRWLGEIPVTKIYSRALTTQEVKQNYKGYKSRFNI